MDWVILFLLVIILGYLIILHRHLDKISAGITRIQSGLIALRVRQGQVTQRKQSNPIPHVDSRARVTKRDTPDLPLTGRMGVAIKREARYDRKHNDS